MPACVCAGFDGGVWGKGGLLESPGSPGKGWRPVQIMEAASVGRTGGW